MIISLPLFYSSSYAQMGVLLAIQMFEIVRVWTVWPFISRRRNWFRLSLEIALALFFLVNFIQIPLLTQIQSGDMNQMAGTIRIFSSLGWLGFILCFYFNLSFVVTGVYDLCLGMQTSARSRMDSARKAYYYNKIADY